MTAVSKRWQVICLVVLFVLCLPLSVVNANLTGKSSSLLSKNLLGFSSNSIELINSKCMLSSGSKHTCPSEHNAASAAKVVVKTMASAKPKISPIVDYQQTLPQNYEKFGFAPQCLFCDSTTDFEFRPSGKSELPNNPMRQVSAAIEKTATAARPHQAAIDAIYSTPDFVWNAKDSEVDDYWRYYSDCDTWNVIFASTPKVTPATKTIAATYSWSELPGQKLSQLLDCLTENFELIKEFVRQGEFQKIESKVIAPGSLIKEKLIDGMKSLRPVIQYYANSELVQNPLMWMKQRKQYFEMEFADSALLNVWNDLVRVPQLGRVAIARDFSPTPSNSTLGGVIKNISWLAQRIGNLADSIKVR